MSSTRPATSRSSLTLTTEKVVKGGRMLARHPDGRVVFVEGALPGETVRVELTKEKKSFAEGSVIEVIEASDDRVDPVCPHVAEGCGGCDWQHVSPPAQSELRRSIVVDALNRLARIPDPVVELGPQLGVDDYRTTVRMALSGGHTGYRARRSNDTVLAPRCTIAHPEVRRIARTSQFGGAEEVTIRVGARTGESLVVVKPSTEGVRLPEGTDLVGASQAKPGTPVYHEEVSGHRFRISAQSFFQCRPDGAEALLSTVGEFIGGDGESLLDAYGGVGLFGVVIGGERAITGVEWSRSSVEDCRVNYPRGAEVVRAKVERYRTGPFDVVVADPARRGLGTEGVKLVLATGAPTLALVSCDPASMARDTGLLDEAGFALERCRTVDLFGQTSHVEAVSLFRRR